MVFCVQSAIMAILVNKAPAIFAKAKLCKKRLLPLSGMLYGILKDQGDRRRTLITAKDIHATSVGRRWDISSTNFEIRRVPDGRQCAMWVYI